MRILVVVMLATGTHLAMAQNAGAGSKFGTRDPFLCKSRKDPAKGAPSASQARDYIKCDPYNGERVDGKDWGQSIFLYENVQVEVGKGRPYQGSEWNIRDIDADSPVYPLRGSLDMYACNLADPKIKAATGFDKYSPGKNCFLYHEPNATGVCYKTGFGDWRCSLGTTPLPSAAQTGIPGPR